MSRPLPSLQLDFVARPANRWRALAWLLLALLLLAGWQVLAHEAALQAESDDLAGRIALLQQRASAARMPARARALAPQDLRAIERSNAVIDELAVPWADLLRSLERAEVRGTGLLALTPNAADRSLRLTGEARSMTELLAYVDRVAAQPLLRQVHLVGYATQDRDGVPALTFTLAANWNRP
ncbi:MAG: hypothetical protein AB9M60_08285 [Leptothrix sp. (in: b-proteobacteria)]